MARERGLRAVLLGLLAAAALAVAAPLASAASLTTTFEGGNGYSGNSFDLEVRPAGGVTVTGIDLHLADPGVSVEVEIWTRPETAAGHESSSVGWTLRDAAVVTSAGPGLPTPTPFSFSLAKGSYGVIVGTPATDLVEYSDGFGVYEDAALKLTSGTGLESPFFQLESDVIEGRIWNGTIHYELTQPTPPAPPQPTPPVAAPVCDAGAAEAKLKRKRAKLKTAQGRLSKAKAFDGAARTRKAKVTAARRAVKQSRRDVKAARRALAKAC